MANGWPLVGHTSCKAAPSFYMQKTSCGRRAPEPCLRKLQGTNHSGLRMKSHFHPMAKWSLPQMAPFIVIQKGAGSVAPGLADYSVSQLSLLDITHTVPINATIDYSP